MFDFLKKKVVAPDDVLVAPIKGMAVPSSSKSKPRLKDVVCSEAISLCYWPAPQGAGFHFVQATMPLTRCSP